MLRCDRRRIYVALCLVAILSACSLNSDLTKGTIVPPTGDVSNLVSDICFEAALALSGQVFILLEQSHLDALYQQIDETRQCDHRITRHSFDFSDGSAILGTWTYSDYGCKASHTASEILRDESAKTITLQYFFAVEGECPYELIRPLWLSVADTAGLAVSLNIQRGP